MFRRQILKSIRIFARSITIFEKHSVGKLFCSSGSVLAEASTKCFDMKYKRGRLLHFTIFINNHNVCTSVYSKSQQTLVVARRD